MAPRAPDHLRGVLPQRAVGVLLRCLMSAAWQRLGHLARMFREDRNRSQAEVARSAGHPVNRSVVAHFEQGLRRPSRAAIEQICATLNIPRALWETVLVQPSATSTRSPWIEPRSERKTIFLAVAGIMGSGKSTLGSALSSIFDFALLPTDPPARKYLPDLSLDRKRWAFETQLAFLVHKTLSVKSALDSHCSIVLDRCVSEDVEVFAEHFRREGYFDDRAYSTYITLANYFRSELPDPDLVIVCLCSPETAFSRIQTRGRSDSMHTLEHIKEIGELHSGWLARQPEASKIMLDSESLDWRQDRVVRQIAAQISQRFSGNESRFLSQRAEQLSFFHDLEPKLDAAQGHTITRKLGQNRASDRIRGTAYLAAPFSSIALTNEASPPSSGSQSSLFPRGHGLVPEHYRSFLERIESLFVGMGFRVVIPHRDVNKWGSVELESEQVVYSCAQQVSQSDLIIAILGQSHGAHFELGYAWGLGKPCIALRYEDLDVSYFARGVNERGLGEASLLSLNIARMGDEFDPSALELIRAFLARHIP